MSDALKIALTALTGIAVFVVGQIIQKLFIEPIQEHRRGVGRIIYLLNYYTNWSKGWDFDLQKEAHLKLMDAASNLAATSRVIPLYSIFALMGLVPTRNNNQNVIQSLMAITQDINPDTLHRHEELIVHELRRLM